MNKVLFVGLGFFLIVAGCARESAQPSPEIKQEIRQEAIEEALEYLGLVSRPLRVKIRVQGSVDDLEVMVRRWRIDLDKGATVGFELLDPHELVTSWGMDDLGKPDNPDICSWPGTAGQVPPDQIISVTFDASTDGNWCGYNIRLTISDTEVVVDPDYRVGPGGS